MFSLKVSCPLLSLVRPTEDLGVSAAAGFRPMLELFGKAIALLSADCPRQGQVWFFSPTVCANPRRVCGESHYLGKYSFIKPAIKHIHYAA
jgi:hypothetical protein